LVYQEAFAKNLFLSIVKNKCNELLGYAVWHKKIPRI
jgi:hypothetical protein